MINQTPSDLGKFPVPPSGHPIPRGWFGRLVRFINSLILHGDGQYLTVKHTQAGQTIAPTPALLQALGQRGAPPAAGSAAQDISASVTGGTATVTLSGSTSAVQMVGTGSVTITGNINGEIEISGSTSGGGGSYPVWGSLASQDLSLTWDSTGENMTPVVLPASGYLYIQFYPSFNLEEGNASQTIHCFVKVDNQEVWGYNNSFSLSPYYSGDPLPVIFGYSQEYTAMIPVHSGSTVTAVGTPTETQLLYLRLYKDLSF